MPVPMISAADFRITGLGKMDSRGTTTITGGIEIGEMGEMVWTDDIDFERVRVYRVSLMENT